MSGDYLHGIKTTFQDGNQTPINLLEASIIGVVGWGKGADAQAFPLNTPVLVNSMEQINKMGEGSLKRAHLDIWKQSPAITVVVRVEHSETPATLKSNLIGSLDNDAGTMTGMKALYRSEQTAGKRPRIIICPEMQDEDIAAALESFYTKYNAIPIAEAKGTGLTSYKAFTSRLGYVYVVAGKATIFDPTTGTDIQVGGSATAAGIMVRTDNQLGFQHSPSNKKALEVKSAGIKIDYTPASQVCAANQYSQENMACFINKKGGCYLWGSRLANGKMIQKERVRLLVADTIRLETEDIVDGNITKPWVDKLLERVQNFLDRMTLDLVVSGGRASVPRDINIANIGLDKFYLDYSIGYYDSAEQVTYRQYMDNTFTEKVFK